MGATMESTIADPGQSFLLNPKQQPKLDPDSLTKSAFRLRNV
jgi:hypothetical protein